MKPSVTVLLLLASGLAATDALHGQFRTDLWDAASLESAASLPELRTLPSIPSEVEEGNVAPNVGSSPSSEPRVGQVVLGSFLGWGVGAVVGLAVADAPGFYLGGALGAGVGAHSANKSRGVWPWNVLAAAGAGALVMVPALPLCLGGCPRIAGVLIGTGVVAMQVSAATAVERRTARIRGAPSGQRNEPDR